MNLFCSYYDLDQTNGRKLRSNTRELFKDFRRQLAGTIKANSPKRAEIMTEQSKLNDKKCMKIDGTNRSYKNYDGTNQLQKVEFSENAILTEPITSKNIKGAGQP